MDSIVKRLRGVIHGIGLTKHISSVTPIPEVDLKAIMKESGGLIYGAGYEMTESGLALITNMQVHNPIGYIVSPTHQLGSYNFGFQVPDTSMSYVKENILFEFMQIQIDPNTTPYPYFTRRECTSVDNTGPSRGFILTLSFTTPLDPQDFALGDRFYMKVTKLD